MSENKIAQTKGRTLGELRLRLDRGRRFVSNDVTPSPVTEEDDSELSETTSLRDDRLLLRWLPSGSSCISLPSGSNDESPKRHTTIGISVSNEIESCAQGGASHEISPPDTPTRTMETPTPSRLANFFSKRTLKTVTLKRTKSVTKLERKRSALDSEIITVSQLRSSRSHESLLQSSPSVLGTVDLSCGDVQVSSVHNSLLDQNHCFQLTSKDGTTYYSCQSGQERDKWVSNIKQTIQPDQDNLKRTEKSLHIWLLEAKGVSSKKRYFCELCLDKTLYARTSSKLKNDLCFWGEHFEFNNLPHLDTITVNLYREADKKKRRDKNILIGSAVIHVSSINSHHLTEKWYPVFVEKGTSGKDPPSLRIKARFLDITILPFSVYSDFLQYLKTDYKTMCEILEPVISVRTKEDIATSLVYIMEKENMAKKFLTDIVMGDIEKIDDQHLMFRGNSTATKAIEAYMKLIGEKYLQDTLGEVIKTLTTCASSEDCEVDPVKVTNNALLQRHQSNLINYVEMVWNRITASAPLFPMELREIFSECRQRLAEKGKDDELCDNLISASVFLRFLCPAILSPSLFNLTQEYPQGKTARKLTLIAKSIQTFANFTRFGGKEGFMEFMNEFLKKEWSTMKSFLGEISSPVSSHPQPPMEFDGHIDEGRELALLHGLLLDCTCKISDKHSSEQLEKLQSVLDGISAALSQPALVRQMSSPTSSAGTPQQPFASDGASTCTADSSLSVTPRSSTIPRSYILGSNQEPADDLSTTDDYVCLSALRTEVSTPVEQKPQTLQSRSPYTLDCERGILYLKSTSQGHQSFSSLQHSSLYHSARRSFSATPNRYSSRGNDFRHARRRLWKHDEDSVETSEDKLLHFASLPRHKLTGHHSLEYKTYNPPDSSSNKQVAHSPRMAPPLAFNNPMYQLKGVPPCVPNQHASPLSSLSSDSDDDISIIGRTCLGSAESEPVLTRGSRYCCTSSSSTDTNSCESPPPPPFQSKVKSFKYDNHHLLKSRTQNQLQPSRSSSDTCSFEPMTHLVHRSSTDSRLHKSPKLKVKSQFHSDYPPTDAREQRHKTSKESSRLSSSPPKTTVEEVGSCALHDS